MSNSLEFHVIVWKRKKMTLQVIIRVKTIKRCIRNIGLQQWFVTKVTRMMIFWKITDYWLFFLLHNINKCTEKLLVSRLYLNMSWSLQKNVEIMVHDLPVAFITVHHYRDCNTLLWTTSQISARYPVLRDVVGIPALTID